jgi:hypothetical protein
MATREGAIACDDAIRFLSSVAPVQDQIFLNFGMCLAAKGKQTPSANIRAHAHMRFVAYALAFRQRPSMSAAPLEASNTPTQSAK